MKKYLPFLITGFLSACLALGLVVILDKPYILDDTQDHRTIFTSYTPFHYESKAYSPGTSPDLVAASSLAKQAVVFIESRSSVSSGYFRKVYSGSTGSGVIISPNGYIATNHHVIEDGEEIMVLMDDGHEYKAKKIGSDPSTDLALLKIDAKNLPYLTFGNSDSLMVGEWVMAVGNPFRLYSTVTAGIVSAKSRNINILDESGIESFIQTDAAVNPGNSGGALVNVKGQLMGINTAIMTFSGQYEGFSFAVPANLASKVLEDIRQYGHVRRGWLGVAIITLDNSTADKMGLQEVAGVLVQRVNGSSAAEAAGLRSGDVITSIDGMKINSSPDFMGKVGQHRPGDILNVVFYRDGKKNEAKVKLSESRNGSSKDIAQLKAPDDILLDMGMKVRDLTTYEENRLPKDGVLVYEITEESQIDAVNMEPNFVITRINGIPVSSIEGFKSELQRAGNDIYLQGYYEEYPGDFAYSLTLR